MANEQSDPAAARASRIVVVEDHREMREMLSELLSVYGFEVHAAASGGEALAVIAREAPDVAVVDIGLPDIDGYELARRIRAGGAAPQLRLVALTGRAEAEDKQQARNAGFDDYLAKPVEAAQLLAALGR
ncbi:MAG TPA: response regulator [Pirellulales bacterium]|nr:response regulator [Pirellulales bacterium]